MKKHVFLSYCRDNFAAAMQLREELIAGGEAVWWDQELLPGQDWKREIRQAMQESYAVVLCLSEEAMARTMSGIFLEAQEAIALYRLYQPGSIFLIPVRLSPCTVPDIAIDATRTLQDLHYVDLFPAAVRAMALQRVLQALQRTPGHPGPIGTQLPPQVPVAPTARPPEQQEAGETLRRMPEPPRTQAASPASQRKTPDPSNTPARPVWAEGYGSDAYGWYGDFQVQGVAQRMRWIAPEDFLMGSPETELERRDDETQHAVRLSHGFWLADTTCTQALWQAVIVGTGNLLPRLKSNNPSYFKGQDRPVEQVSWNDVQGFLPRLNALVAGGNFRLPTEAEWEYACRAGTTTPFWFGEEITPEQVNYHGDYPYANGKKGLYRGETVPVKALPCNSWGLYQMHGNVWEWCQDWYAPYAAATAEDPAVDPAGSAAGAHRVLRGGGWIDFGGYARSAQRHAIDPGNRFLSFGFRLALSQAR